jgi:hypothetical protein
MRPSLSPLLLAVPASNVTVTVKVLNSFPTLDTSLNITLPQASAFYFPVINPGAELVADIYAFYIEHPVQAGKANSTDANAGNKEVERYMFDIGIRKDYENLAPSLQGLFQGTIPTDIPTQLVEGGVALESIKQVFWR